MTEVLHAIFFVLIFGAVFTGVIALEWTYTRWKGLTGVYHFKETLANMGTGFTYKMVDGISIALFIQAFYSWVYQFGWQWNPPLSFWSVLLLIVLVDFCFYLNHVLMHKTRWFWAAHVTHHSSEHMNFSTALRQNFIHDLNGGWILWWIPAALVGFDKNWVLFAIEGNLVYQFFLHTEQVKRLGWLEILLNTPSHHRVHHGRNPQQIDTNFGGIFIVWDRLFGTFRDEREAGEIHYGVTRMPAKPYNPIYLQLFELRSLWQDIRRYRDWTLLYRPPEYAQQKYARGSVPSATQENAAVNIQND